MTEVVSKLVQRQVVGKTSDEYLSVLRVIYVDCWLHQIYIFVIEAVDVHIGRYVLLSICVWQVSPLFVYRIHFLILV
jgi:hypothetical protein